MEREMGEMILFFHLLPPSYKAKKLNTTKWPQPIPHGEESNCQVVPDSMTPKLWNTIKFLLFKATKFLISLLGKLAYNKTWDSHNKVW